jgi:hypothetical protein
MAKYITIKDTTINGNTYQVQRYLSEHDFFNSDRFKRVSDTCIHSVESVIERDKELLEKIVDGYRIGRYNCDNIHALRLLIYNDARVVPAISRLQTEGANHYGVSIKKEIAGVIHEDYMQLPEYMRSAVSEDTMVNEIVKDFLYKNNKEIRKAVSDAVYQQLRKVIDKELL